jgi:hypothetical protein
METAVAITETDICIGNESFCSAIGAAYRYDMRIFTCTYFHNVSKEELQCDFACS